MVITGGLDDFFDFKPGLYCVSRNWTDPPFVKVGNTSIFRFPVGGHPYLYDRIVNDPEGVMARYRTEQAFISAEITQMEFWPKPWCLSFKHSLLPRWPLNLFQAPSLPRKTRVVAFTGKPDPDEAMIGLWPQKRWHHRLYRHVEPTPWIAENWR
jgi:hypothetical protein